MASRLESSKPRTSVYVAAKRFFLELEIAGVLSTQVLQAAVLIALFQLGHAVYPSAYLAIATCARYATALGMDWRTAEPVEGCGHWVDEE